MNHACMVKGSAGMDIGLIFRILALGGTGSDKDGYVLKILSFDESPYLWQLKQTVAQYELSPFVFNIQEA